VEESPPVKVAKKSKSSKHEKKHKISAKKAGKKRSKKKSSKKSKKPKQGSEHVVKTNFIFIKVYFWPCIPYLSV